MRVRTSQIYRHAGQIIAAAMGADRVADDPLAYWCGIFAIVELIQGPSKASRKRSASKII